MKTYQLEILQSDVFDSISALTHYTGAKDTADQSAFDRIATIDANDEILSKFWLQASNQLVIMLSQFLGNVYYQKQVTTTSNGTSTTTQVPGIFVTLNMTSNWDPHLLPALTQAASNFMLARITELWYRMTNVQGIEQQMADAAAASTEIRILLYSKTRPSTLSDFFPATSSTGTSGTGTSGTGTSDQSSQANS